jgi:hypothetical protein
MPHTVEEATIVEHKRRSVLLQRRLAQYPTSGKPTSIWNRLAAAGPRDRGRPASSSGRSRTQ